MCRSRLTLSAVAKQVDKHVATVWRWTSRGVGGRRLATIKIGGRRYVREADLAAFLAADPTDTGSPVSPAAPNKAEAAGHHLDDILS